MKLRLLCFKSIPQCFNVLRSRGFSAPFVSLCYAIPQYPNSDHLKVVNTLFRTWLFPSMYYVLTTKHLHSPLHLSNKSIMQPYLQSGDGPIVLVLAPTRELALQIKQECDKFGASSEIKNTVVYGGVPKSTQVRDLR